MTKEEFESLYEGDVTEEFYNDVVTIQNSLPPMGDNVFANYIQFINKTFIAHLAQGFRYYEEKTKHFEEKIEDLRTSLQIEVRNNKSNSKSYDDEEIGNLLYDVMREEQDDDQVRDTCIALLGNRNYVERVLDDSNISEEDKNLIRDLIG